MDNLKNDQEIETKKYIKIDPKKLDLEIVPEKPNDGFVVPARLSYQRSLSPIEKTIYLEVLYRVRYERDRRNGIKNVAYKLFYPDAWLVSISYIILEGIVQGLAWDSLKFIVKRALKKLQENNLAPKKQSNSRKVKSKTKTKAVVETQYHYVEYATNGRKLYSIYRHLKRVYCEKSVTEIEQILDSKVDDFPNNSSPLSKNFKRTEEKRGEHK